MSPCYSVNLLVVVVGSHAPGNFKVCNEEVYLACLIHLYPRSWETLYPLLHITDFFGDCL